MVNQADVVTSSTEVKDPVLTEQDKQNFFKSVLADKPFEETFALFDGQHHVTFKTMTVQENEDVIVQVKIDQKAGIAENTDAYFVQLASYRLAQSLSAIDGKPYVVEITKADYKADDKTTYVAAKAASLKVWPAFKLSLYLDVFNQFEKKVIALGKEVQSANFWTAST